LAKPNYRHAKKQKEDARKARKLEKLERKQQRSTDPESSSAPLPDADVTPAATADKLAP
jgi:hypothetical protein